MFERKVSKFLLPCIVLCFVLSFSISSVSGEDTKHGLSVDNVHIFYFAKDETLKVLFALLNTGNTEVTVLVENLNTAWLGESEKQICEIGAGIKSKFNEMKP